MTLDEYWMKLASLMAITDDADEFTSQSLALRQELKVIGFKLIWCAPLNTYIVYPTRRPEAKKDVQTTTK